LVFIAALQARAGEEPVILLVTRAEGSFVGRLRAELESMGFRVVVQRDDAAPPDGTVAIGRLAAGPPPVLDIENVGGDQPGSRQSVVFDGANVATEIGSVRMAERVRAAFQPLAPRSAEVAQLPAQEPPPGQAPLVQPPPPASPSPARALTRPPTPRVAPQRPPSELEMGVSLGPALTVDVGEVGLHAAASYYVSPLARLRIEPFVLVPLVPTSREGPEGEAHLYAGMIGALLNGVAFDSEHFELVLGGGVSGVWVRVEGAPAAGYVDHTDDAFAAGFIADVATRIGIYDGFFVTPRAYLGLTLPIVNVELNGRSVERWGLPFFAVALAAEFDWTVSR
jgi:hypothetical protein